MANKTNANEIVFAFREHGQDMERGMADELAVLAQIAVRTMQRLAPKSRSKLVTSIEQAKVSDLEYNIGPTADYAWSVEHGVKPGGKGLPRFFDPASASIVDWLKAHPRGGGFAPRAGKFGSKVFQAANLALRDSYEALAWHVRHKGVKAQPFVEPTAKEMEGQMLRRLDLAVRRVLAARPDAGGAAA
jgi:hypothetical protein